MALEFVLVHVLLFREIPTSHESASCFIDHLTLLVLSMEWMESSLTRLYGNMKEDALVVVLLVMYFYGMIAVLCNDAVCVSVVGTSHTAFLRCFKKTKERVLPLKCIDCATGTFA